MNPSDFEQWLGHLDHFGGWARRIPRVGGSQLIAAVFRKAEAGLHSEEAEHAADRTGLELCVKAGFDQQSCLQLFDTLKMHALDYGDLESVFGVDDEPDLDAGLLERLFVRFHAWASSLGRSHPPINDRKSRLRALVRAGSRSSP